MQALRLHGPRDLRLHEEPDPVPAAGDELVRVTAVGICGSDLHWYEHAAIGAAHLPAPLVVGHEAAGVITTGARAGQLVAIDPAIPCGACRECGLGHRNLCLRSRFLGAGTVDGALRTLLAWPAEYLVPVPAELDDVDAAVLEALGVAVHAADLGRVEPGASVGVYGCGPIGLLLVQLARLAGASRIVATDLLPHRLEAALRYGATETSLVDAGHERSILHRVVPGGTDVAFELAGSDDSLETALRLAAPASRVIVVGVPTADRTTIRTALARRKETTLLFSRRMTDVYPRAVELVRSGRVDVRSLVSAVQPLEAFAPAFEAAAARSGLKVVLRPTPFDQAGDCPEGGL